jgi:TrfA protein
MTKQLLTRDIAEVMESLHRTLETKAKKKEETPPDMPAAAPKPQAKIVHLPLWPEPTRGTPNSFLRGALFAAIQGKERYGLQRQVLASQKGSTIRFTGIQLDQSDLDVWEQAAQLARTHPLGNVCHFHIHAFLKALRRNTGKSDHEWLKYAFARLAGCCVEITEGCYTYGGAMLEFRRDEIVGVYIVRLNPTILNLYNAGWTAIDWDIRQKLRRKPLALWLHGWLSSNAKNYPVKVETLHRLSGSRNAQKAGVKRHLAKALDDLQAVDAISSYSFTSGLLTIERKPSPAQLRHLSKKARRKPCKNGEK